MMNPEKPPGPPDLPVCKHGRTVSVMKRLVCPECKAEKVGIWSEKPKPEPLEIMDEIGSRSYCKDDTGICMNWDGWHRLRDAVKESGARIKWLEAQVQAAMEFDAIESETMVCGICGGDKGFIAGKQAEALREASERIGNDPDDALDVQTWLEREADRIEREAKESE